MWQTVFYFERKSHKIVKGYELFNIQKGNAAFCASFMPKTSSFMFVKIVTIRLCGVFFCDISRLAP